MNSKPVLATISFLFLAFSIYAGVLLVTAEERIDTRSQAAATPTVSIEVDSPTTPLNQHFAATIKMDTAGEPIDQATFILKYDPEELTALSVTPQEIFSQQTIIANEIDHTFGQITLRIQPASGATPLPFEGIAAIIVFEGIQTGNASVEFDQATSASLNPTNTNIFTQFTPATITIE